MEQSTNPYQAPLQEAPPTETVTSDQTWELLRQTRPWVRIISGLMMLFGGFTLVASILVPVFMLRDGSIATSVTLFVTYAVMSLMYFLPATFLWRYSTNITRGLRSPSVATLNEALRAQKSFWKFVAIAFLVIVGLYLVMLLGVGMFGMMSAF